MKIIKDLRQKRRCCLMGCMLPMLLLLLLLSLNIYKGRNNKKLYYIPNIKMNLKIERKGDMGYVHFLKNKMSSSNFIMFKISHSRYEDIYILSNGTIYAKNYNNHIIQVKSDRGNIITTDYVTKDTIRVVDTEGRFLSEYIDYEWTDSTIFKTPCCSIHVDTYNSGITVFDHDTVVAVTVQ